MVLSKRRRSTLAVKGKRQWPSPFKQSTPSGSDMAIRLALVISKRNIGFYTVKFM